MSSFTIRQYGTYLVLEEPQGLWTTGHILGNYVQLFLVPADFDLTEGVTSLALIATGKVTSRTTIEIIVQGRGIRFNQETFKTETLSAIVGATLERN